MSTCCPHLSASAVMIKAARVASFSAVAMLLGCAVGPDFRPPQAPQAEHYLASSEQASLTDLDSPPEQTSRLDQGSASGQKLMLGEALRRDWWTLFGSEALNAVVERALQGNRTLVTANATLAQARELAAAQAGGLYPQLGLTAGTGAQKYGAEFLGSLPKPPPFTYYAIGPTVSYALDYTGGVARSVEQQYALAEYQRQELAATFLTVTGDVVMQSLRIALLREEIRTVEALLDEDRQNQRLVQTAFTTGSVSRVDVVTAESQLASDTTLLPPLEQELSVARHALTLLFGQTAQAPAPPDPELGQLQLPHDLPVSLPSELVHRRPDILASEAQLHASTAAVGVAEANLYPHISLSATAGQQANVFSHMFDGASSVYSVTGSLVAPLFDGGTLRAQKRAAADALKAQTASYEQTVLTAFTQVADSLEALQHDLEQLEAEQHAQDAARENLELTRKSYAEGNVGVLEVLDAERVSQNARLGYVRAEAQRYMDTAQLFLAVGGSGPDAAGPTVTRVQLRR